MIWSFLALLFVVCILCLGSSFQPCPSAQSSQQSLTELSLDSSDEAVKASPLLVCIHSTFSSSGVSTSLALVLPRHTMTCAATLFILSISPYILPD